jgi:hypothetical protein
MVGLWIIKTDIEEIEMTERREKTGIIEVEYKFIQIFQLNN